MTETGKTTSSARNRQILQDLHDQGVIDLDAPMRQLLDKMDATGEVSGYQLKGHGPEEDKVWVYYIEDGKGGGATFAGTGLKDDPRLKG